MRLVPVNLPFRLRLFVSALLLGLSGCFVSCATTKIHYVDEGAASQLKGPRNVAIGGVLGTGSAEGMHPEDRDDIASFLEQQLKKKRRHLAVSSPMLFESIVGRPYVRPRSDRTSLSHFLAPSQQEKLRNSRFDYVLFLVLDQQETWCDVEESEDTEEEHEYDRHGNIIACYTTTTYTTSSRAHRKASGDFLLFDARTGKRVWKASSQNSECHTRSSCSTISYPLPPPHPDPPTLADVVQNMSQSMSRKFPKR